jgi:uncharacterized protein
MKGDINEIAAPFVNSEKGVNNTEEALAGAMDIIAESVSDNAEVRKAVRELFFKHGMLVSKALKEEDSVYRMYYDFKEPVSKIAKHRILAINRGEKEEYLQAGIEVPEELIVAYIKSKNVRKNRSITTGYVERAVVLGIRGGFFSA